MKIGNKIKIKVLSNLTNKEAVFDVILEGIYPLTDTQCEVCGRRKPETKYYFIDPLNVNNYFYVGTSCIKTIIDNVLVCDYRKFKQK